MENHSLRNNPTNNTGKWLRILAWFCPKHLYEEIEGDLIQKFQRDAKTFGEKKAKRRFIWNVVRFFRPEILFRNKFSFQQNEFFMLHFLKIFYRTTFLKNRGYSLINVSGLAIGLASSILILLWVLDEIKYDHSHYNKDRIYQIMGRHTYPDNVMIDDGTPGPLAGGLVALPEIEESCRVTFQGGKILFTYNDKSIYEEGVYADASIFKIFTIPLFEGNSTDPLPDITAIAISQQLANKYFKNESAIGKVLQLNSNLDARVTAVFENLPENSSVKFDFILPYQIYAKEDPYNNEWGAWTGGKSYVKLHSGTTPEILNKKINEIITKPKIWPRWDTNVELFLFPMNDWRLYNNFNKNGIQDGGRISYVKGFTCVAIFILLIACINFMNLATARSISRSKEVGVRKVIGAAKGSLIRQFIGESLLISFLALFIGLLLVHLLLPYFNDLTGKKLDLEYTNPLIYGSLIGITFFSGLTAGCYPAFFLSSLNPINILKGKVLGLSGSAIRKSLVVFQFSLSVILIICALVIHKQIEYMRNKNLGFDKKNIFYFNSNDGLRKKFESFRNESLQNPHITYISQANANPAQIFAGMVLADNAWQGKAKEDNVVFNYLQCDYDFLPTLGFTFLAGRNFSRDFSSDSLNYIINEEAARRMKLSDPVGKELIAPHKGQVIGVLKDFHSAKLQNPIQPVIIAMRPANTDRIFIRYKPGHLREAMTSIQELFKKFESTLPIEFAFMDEPFGRQYENEILIGKLSTCFTFIAIFISCLGLFGLASYTTQRRAKEIGIRKVMGATVIKLISLLCRDYVVLIAIASTIAMPIAWWIAHKFITGYAFHANLSLWIFVITGLSMLFLALLTVSYQSAKAAIVNPVKSLRTE